MNTLTSFFAGILAFIGSVFGHHAQTPSQPVVQQPIEQVVEQSMTTENGQDINVVATSVQSVAKSTSTEEINSVTITKPVNIEQVSKNSKFKNALDAYTGQFILNTSIDELLNATSGLKCSFLYKEDSKNSKLLSFYIFKRNAFIKREYFQDSSRSEIDGFISEEKFYSLQKGTTTGSFVSVESFKKVQKDSMDHMIAINQYNTPAFALVEMLPYVCEQVQGEDENKVKLPTGIRWQALKWN
jgi:hypothetical protein